MPPILSAHARRSFISSPRALLTSVRSLYQSFLDSSLSLSQESGFWEITASLYCPSFSSHSNIDAILLFWLIYLFGFSMWSVVNKSQRCNSGSGINIVISATFLRWYSSVHGWVNGIVWPFSPSPAYLSMHSGLWWLMSGQEEEKPIPRLQCGTGDGWFFASLCRNERRRPEGWEEDRRGGKDGGQKIYIIEYHVYISIIVCFYCQHRSYVSITLKIDNN